MSAHTLAGVLIALGMVALLVAYFVAAVHFGKASA